MNRTKNKNRTPNKEIRAECVDASSISRGAMKEIKPVPKEKETLTGKNTGKTKKKNKKRVALIVVLVIFALLAGAGIFAYVKGNEYYGAYKMMSASAEELKSGLNEVADNVKKGDYKAAEASIAKVDNVSSDLRRQLADPKWEIVPKVYPEAGEDMQTAAKLLDVVDEASATLLKPAVKYLNEKGLPKKSTFTKEMLLSDKFPALLVEYADLIDELCPAVEKVLADFNSLPKFNIEKLESKVSKYRVLAKDNEPEIKAYLVFFKDTAKDFLRPVAQELKGKDLSLGEGKLTDKIGPELASKLVLYADLIEKLVPLADNTLAKFNELPVFKIKDIEDKIGKYRELAKNEDIKKLFILATEVSAELLRPSAKVMDEVPFSKLKVGSGIDTRVIRAYLDLVEKLKPSILKINTEIREIELIKKYPKISEKLFSKLDSAMPLLDEFETYKPLIDVVLGDGKNKLYVVVAMNSAEMRACGGFPGSIGVVTIKNGMLKIGKFSGFRKVIQWGGEDKKYISATKVEYKMFLGEKGWFNRKLTCAIDNPHFPRAAKIIADGYQKTNKVKPDGVIAMTPHILGRLIGITHPIKISNGKLLDEMYAIKYIQHDIYVQYYAKYPDKKKQKRAKVNTKVDGLFAEVAETTLKNVMSNLDIKGVKAILDVIKKSGEDRVFYMWMANSKAQKTVKSLGLSGSLNYDSKKPEIGVFYTIYGANKLGYYTDLNVTYGEGKKNANGTITYPVTVRLRNSIDKTSQKLGKGNSYITSLSFGATMQSNICFFAPAGGTISNFKSSRKDVKGKTAKYQGLKAYYCKLFPLKPRSTVTFTFTVTTARGVTDMPKVVHTAMLTEYRNAKEPQLAK